MLGRAWRRLVVVCLWPLVKLADPAAQRIIANQHADLRDERHQRALSEDKTARVVADLEHAVAWRDRELARLKMEADIYRAKSIAADIPDRE